MTSLFFFFNMLGSSATRYIIHTRTSRPYITCNLHMRQPPVPQPHPVSFISYLPAPMAPCVEAVLPRAPAVLAIGQVIFLSPLRPKSSGGADDRSLAPLPCC